LATIVTGPTVTLHPFVVHVARLRKVSGTRWHEVRRGVVPDVACTGSAVPEGDECVADVTLEAVAGGVSVVGTVRARWVGECRRCLGPAEGTIAVRVRELFTVGGDGEETYPLEEDVLDLEPMVHDAILLELPQAPLCDEGCRGLCPECGADRNREACTCQPPGDPRWAVLDALRGDGGASPGAG